MVSPVLIRPLSYLQVIRASINGVTSVDSAFIILAGNYGLHKSFDETDQISVCSEIVSCHCASKKSP